jgi:hypothetical protein
MSAWDAVKYGWNVVYWVTIEGIPVVFTERGLGLTLPSGYEREDASLVIDDSSEVGSEVDRRRGLGAGLSLGFRLLDTSVLRDYIRKPSKTAELTQDETATANTIHVDSTVGWPNAGQFWLGHELISYTGKTGTTFTGCARGVAGLAYLHRLVSAGNVATSSPRWWRGRVVTLWASPVNPAGLPSGAALTTDAVQVWRGKISDGPNRGMAWWDFQADALERVLDRPLAAKLSGKIVPTATTYLPPTGLKVEYQVKTKNAAGAALWAYSFTFYPFANVNPATYLSGDQMRARIAGEFMIAVAAAGAAADVLGLNWHPVPGENAKAGKVLPGWAACIAYDADANVNWFYHELGFYSKDGNNLPKQVPQIFLGGLPTGELSTDWVSGDNPIKPQQFNGAFTSSITVQLDSGLEALVPAKGLMKVQPNSDNLTPQVVKYGAVSQSVAGLVFSMFTAPNGTGSGIDSIVDDLIGGSIEILFSDEGTPEATALRLLHTSGTGLRSATWDTLKQGCGYGFDGSWVDQDSFAALLGAGAAGQLQLRVAPAGASFADIFSGLLALSRVAVVSRTVDGSTKIAAVRTDMGGAEYFTTIRDVDLLAVGGDPVEVQTKLTPLNRITVKRAPYGMTWDSVGKVSGGDDQPEDTAIFSDIPAILALGEEGLDATVPALDNDQLTQYALPLAMSTFAGDQTAQAVSLMVGPWVSAQVGDLVRLELTHPSLWDYATQLPGYSGAARIVGRTIELRTLRVKLTMLINSSITTKNLAPAARVSAFAGAANNPTSIDVGLQYLPHFQQAIAGAGWAWACHYKPGQTEAAGDKFGINAAANVGGVCRLTVIGGSWSAGTLSIGERSHITVPSTNDSNTFQNTYTHGRDGSRWS